MDRPNFHFRRREEKLDWKKLAALDVDQITKTVDYKALQDSIRQITYCDASKEFDADSTDPNLVKVFRMSQLIIEYLLQSQDFLANNLASVEQRLNATLEEVEAARQRSRRDQEELRDLRKGLRAPASSTVMTLTGHQRCHFCQKVFINTTYLQSHMMRRHNHMASKQISNQTLSTVMHDQPSPPDTLVAELEQVRRRLLVAEQQLREERRRVSALEHGAPYQPTEQEPDSPTYHHTIQEEPEPPPEDSASAGHSVPGSRQDSRRGSAGGSRQGSGGGSRQGSGGGSRQGSGGGSRQGSGGGSRQDSGGGSRQDPGGGSRQDSGGGSHKDSGGESGQVSASGSAGQRDSQLAVLLEQQAAEIRQLREELERQRQMMQQAAAAQPPAPSLLGGPAAAQQQQQQQQSEPEPEPGSRVEQEIQKQARRDVVALEGQMEAQERYWQSKLGAMRERHDAEVEGMREMLNGKNAATRGSAEYVNIDSGAERSPRLLRFVRRHQSPSPGPPPPPPPPPQQGRGARTRPRPCLSRQQRRSRSVSGCRRLKFADDEDECDEEEEAAAARGGPARESLSSDALARSGGAGGRPAVRQELESELNERLLELGIEPGTRRIPSGLMTDKMKHLQLSRQVLGFGDLRRQVDQDVNQRLTKFVALPTKRTSKLALFAKDMMHRGAEMSRSLVSIGNNRGRAPCTSATIDAQLMQRMVAAEKAGGRLRASSDSPSSDRRPLADTAPGWPREERDDQRDWQQRQHTRYEAASYDEEEDFRPRQGGRKFKFKANASKHILERFTRRGHCQSSLIKSTTIHRVESGDGLDGDGGDPSGRYEKLREEKPPAGRQGSSSSLAARRASAERQAVSEPEKPSAGFAVFQGSSSEKLPASRSGSVPGMSGGLKPADPAEEGFVTPMSRPASGSGPTSAAPNSPASNSPASNSPAPNSPTPPAIPQIDSDEVTPKEESFDDSEVSNRVESSPPPNIPTMDPVDARPSGSANTLSTSQWNSAADGGAAVDSSAADETETVTSRTSGSSSSEEETDEDGDEDEAEPGDQ